MGLKFWGIFSSKLPSTRYSYTFCLLGRKSESPSWFTFAFVTVVDMWYIAMRPQSPLLGSSSASPVAWVIQLAFSNLLVALGHCWPCLWPPLALCWPLLALSWPPHPGLIGAFTIETKTDNCPTSSRVRPPWLPRGRSLQFPVPVSEGITIKKKVTLYWGREEDVNQAKLLIEENCSDD